MFSYSQVCQQAFFTDTLCKLNNLMSLKALCPLQRIFATPFNCPCGRSMGCNLPRESSTCNVTRDVTTSTEASAFRVIRVSCASSAGYLPRDSTDVWPAFIPQELPCLPRESCRDKPSLRVRTPGFRVSLCSSITLVYTKKMKVQAEASKPHSFVLIFYIYIYIYIMHIYIYIMHIYQQDKNLIKSHRILPRLPNVN